MGGKNKPDNSQVVQQQQQEAAQEAAKEAARQARLTQGLASIKQAFEGSPVMASTTKPFDWSSFKPAVNQQMALWESQNPTDPNAGQSPITGANLPDGYTAVQVAGKSAAGGSGAGGGFATLDPTLARGNTGSSMAGWEQLDPLLGRGNTGANAGGFAALDPTLARGNTGAGGAGGTVWAVKGPDGKIYYPGDDLNITTQTDTGQKTGGFDDAFYNKYKQSVLDYYMPQVDKQYKDARDQATFGLARSGNLTSSAANTLVADLANQNEINQAGVRNQADTAAGDLRNQVSSEEQKAVSQLYATEDPEVAANQSLAAVRDISLQQPNFSPLSSLFNVASIGGANVLKGYNAQKNLNTFNAALPKDKSTVVG